LTPIAPDSILSDVAERECLLEIVRTEIHLHPDLTEEDLWKLLHQAAFGCDHLLLDPEAFVRDLRAEWDRLAVGPERSDEPLLQVIDPARRTARLHLRPCRSAGIPLEAVSSFLVSQPMKCGSKDRFEHLLSLVEALRRDGAIDLLPSVSPAREGLRALIGHHGPRYGAVSYRVINDLTERRTAVWVEETLSGR